MAVTKVTASLAGGSSEMTEERSVYSGELTAPRESGTHTVTVSAYDDAGNVAVRDTAVNVSLWHSPKTNWKSTDRFNIEDYNRIKNNLIYLHEFALSLYFKGFDIDDMGPDLESYAQYWEVLRFNQFESNLDKINKNIFTRDYGTSQRFFENGPFIQWQELNRIESAILQMNSTLENQKVGLKRLSFRLGQFREVKV